MMIDGEELEIVKIALLGVCDPVMAKNVKAWAVLDSVGITCDVMRILVDCGVWRGPPPIFDAEPDYTGKMWLLMRHGMADLDDDGDTTITALREG